MTNIHSRCTHGTPLPLRARMCAYRCLYCIFYEICYRYINDRVLLGQSIRYVLTWPSVRLLYALPRKRTVGVPKEHQKRALSTCKNVSALGDLYLTALVSAVLGCFPHVSYMQSVCFHCRRSTAHIAQPAYTQRFNESRAQRDDPEMRLLEYATMALPVS